MDAGCSETSTSSWSTESAWRYSAPTAAGKSTLLRFVVGEGAPTLGSVRVGENITPGYMPQDQAGLDWSMSALEMIRQATDVSETEARTLLHLYLFEGDEPLLPASSLSYGQRSRLLLATLVLEGRELPGAGRADEPSRHPVQRAVRGGA